MLKTAIGTSTKGLLKDTSIYGTGSLINQFIPVLLLPILTRYLSPEEYGLVAIFTVVTAILVNFVGLNLSAALQRNYVDYPKSELSQHVGTAILVALFTAAFWSAVAFGGNKFLSSALAIPGKWLYIIVLISFCQVVIGFFQIILRMERKALAFIFFQITQTLVNITLSVLFVVIFLWHWQGRVLGLVGSATVCALLSVYFLYKSGFLLLCFSKKAARSMLLFGAPLVFHTLSAWIITGSDRLFLVNMIGASAVGLYSVGYTIGRIIELLQQSFSQAWVPFLFERLKEDKNSNKLQIVKFIYVHHVAIIGMVLLLHFAAPLILKIVAGKNFQSSADFVFWVAAGYALNGMYRMIVPFINYARKTHLLPIGASAAAFSNLGLNYLLIKLNGPIGAAQATFSAFLIFYIITLILCVKVYPLPWFFWRYSKAG
jgi:O-antigen/teichoic acid export membrane protein